MLKFYYMNMSTGSDLLEVSLELSDTICKIIKDVQNPFTRIENSSSTVSLFTVCLQQCQSLG